MSEFIITSEQLKTATEAYLERELSRPITDVFISGDKLPEIVRCRDCKHMHTVRHWLGMDVDECWLRADPESGALGKEPTEPDGFCAWGERKSQKVASICDAEVGK